MSEARPRAHVYSIPPDTRFLETLVQEISNGHLLRGALDPSDPFALSDLTIYLPTRRATSLLQAEFEKQMADPFACLPTIKAFGDVDEEEGVFDQPVDAALGEDIAPPAIDALSRQIVLTELVRAWGAALHKNTDAEPLLMPASPADAVWLASDLGTLLDRAITEKVSWTSLQDLVPDEYAAFWSMSLDFLKIVTESWPAYLAEHGLVDQATRRDALIDLETKRIVLRDKPVIAAGSTGTLPSTARLLAAVAHHPKGALVLPGLDLDMSDEAFDTIGDAAKLRDAETAHPQYGLKRLLTTYVGATRAEVVPLGRRVPSLSTRTKLVSSAMLPADATADWPSLRGEFLPDEMQQSFAGVSLIEARTDAEEARAVACALRAHVDEGTGLAALVTPDRTLARRVALELRRWGLEVDDSAGRPLVKAGPAIVALLLVDFFDKKCDPVALLSLMNHPLATFGLEPGDVRRAARVIDLAVLRGPRLAGGLDAVRRRLDAISNEVMSGTQKEPSTAKTVKPSPFDTPTKTRSRIPRAVAQYKQEDWDLAATLVDRLINVLTPLETAFAEEKPTTLAHLAALHKETFIEVLGGAETHTGDAAFEALCIQFDGLAADEGTRFSLKPSHYPGLFRAFLGTQTIRQRPSPEPRILILGALEARLLAPDIIVLGGLDEGVWPDQAKTDAFLSRGMRAGISMEPPERRIGLAAHDVTQALGVEAVILSRAVKRSDTPVVMSRWLQRITALLGDPVTSAMRERGDYYLTLARALDRHDRGAEAKIEKAVRPNPKPPVSARPTGLSVTRIEQWVRDPYDIYASEILQLHALDALGKIPDFSTRGTIIHEIMDRFVQVWDGQINQHAKARLLEIGNALFQETMTDFPEMQALWWPQFEKMAESYLKFEESRDPAARVRHAEIYAALDLPVDGEAFRLSGTIDRLDEMTDGSLVLLDFKTGKTPSPREVKSGLNAQLALELTMLMKGAYDFKGTFSTRQVSSIGWVKLGGNEPVATFRSALEAGTQQKPGDTAEDLARLAEKQITALIRRYRRPDQGYLSRARPDFERRFTGNYDHLARVRAWQSGEGESD